MTSVKKIVELNNVCVMASTQPAEVGLLYVSGHSDLVTEYLSLYQYLISLLIHFQAGRTELYTSGGTGNLINICK